MIKTIATSKFFYKMSAQERNKTVLDILRSVPYFEGLDEKSLKSISSVAIHKSYKPEEIVFLEGDPSDGMFVVESGWLKASKVSLGGREQILDTFGPMEMLNAISVFLDSPRQVTVSALEAATLWYLPAKAIAGLVESDPVAAKAIIRTLAKRIQFLIAKVEDLALHSVEARLARYLTERHSEGRVERKKWDTQAGMAAQIGTVPDVLNRALRKFEERGLIKVSRQHIELIEADKLKDIAMD